MTEQHDAPKLVFSHYEDDQPVFMPRPATIAPPAPSGLVDAGWAYLAVMDDVPGPEQADYLQRCSDYGRRLKQARVAFEAALSGQPSTPPAPVGYLREAGFCDDPFADLWSIVHEEDEDLRVRAGKDYVAALRKALPATLSGQQGGAVPAGDREVIARAIYGANPFYQGGEYVDNLLVSPGHDLTWEEALETDALRAGNRLFRPILASAYAGADAALRARLAEQPAPAGTGAAGVEGLRKAAQDVLAIWDDTSDVPWMVNVDKRMETLRAALDAGSSEEGR